LYLLVLGFDGVLNAAGVATACRDIDECEADEATGATICGECYDYDSIGRKCDEGPKCSQTSGDGQTTPRVPGPSVVLVHKNRGCAAEASIAPTTGCASPQQCGVWALINCASKRFMFSTGYYGSSETRCCSSSSDAGQDAGQDAGLYHVDNSAGTYFCRCPAGMTGGGEQSPCVDIDECNAEPVAANCTSEDVTVTGACELDVAAQRCAPATGYGACSFVPEVKGPADVCGPGGECLFGSGYDPGYFYCHCTDGHHGGGDSAVYRPTPYASKRFGVTSVSTRPGVTRAHAPRQECRANTCTCGNGTAAAGAACDTHGAHSCVMVKLEDGIRRAEGIFYIVQR
jgi:hypothetical protein